MPNSTSFLIIFWFMAIAVVGLTSLNTASALLEDPPAPETGYELDSDSELPSEWRWQRNAIRFEEMFMRR